MATAAAARIARALPADARDCAARHGGLVSAFVTREQRGQGQRCPWELVSMRDGGPLERAAVAWIVAEAVMRQRCGPSPTAYPAWEEATLAGDKLAGTGRELVLAFAESVFKPTSATAKQEPHGVPGYVGEWLWYLLAREKPDLPELVKEYLAEPTPTVTDSGGDGLLVYRVYGRDGSTLGFRLWEMKKMTAGSDQVSGTVSGAWDQLAGSGARYLAGQMAWAYRAVVDGDVRDLIAVLPDLWLVGDPRAGAGVSVAANSSATPKQRAFSKAHERIPHLRHEGQLQGMIIAVDDFADFAAHVQEIVWTAL